jgi:hypothetical protein
MITQTLIPSVAFRLRHDFFFFVIVGNVILLEALVIVIVLFLFLRLDNSVKGPRFLHF